MHVQTQEDLQKAIEKQIDQLSKGQGNGLQQIEVKLGQASLKSVSSTAAHKP